MANIKTLKKRVKSAKNISQISRAMQMVAASKMRRAQEKALLGRPYQEKILEAVAELSGGVDRRSHPLLKEGLPTGKTLLIVISTNKGLCGGLNSGLFRQIDKWFPKENRAEFISLGKKGESFILRTGRKLVADFSAGNFLAAVSPVSQLFTRSYISGEYKEVYLAFNRFITSLKQEPARRKILPLGLIGEKNRKELFREFLIEPSPSPVLDSLLPHYLEIEVRNAVLEAEACEHSARMLAMKNATDNARSLISDLTLEYNRLRQEAITYEIADMVTARIAVRG